jgi:peroxiredoxin-like protein
MEQQYEYQAQVTWTGEKKGRAEVEGLPALEVAIPPEFGGHEGIWSPESMLVASVASCIMTTFIAIAEASKFSYSAYESTAKGLLERTDSGYRFTSIEVAVKLTVGAGDETKAERLLEKAEANCFISKSVNAEVTLKPTVVAG